MLLTGLATSNDGCSIVNAIADRAIWGVCSSACLPFEAVKMTLRLIICPPAGRTIWCCASNYHALGWLLKNDKRRRWIASLYE